MISPQTLERAIAEGVLLRPQAERLLALEAERNRAEFEPLPDREKLRFITGFGDIFVVIGIGLFGAALGYFLLERLGAFWGFAALAGMAWLLAELFTRWRRMALPSIVLLVAFAGASFLAGNVLVAWLAAGARPALTLATPGFATPLPSTLAALLTAALVALHYWRFHVPITIAAGVAALAATGIGVFALIAPRFVEAALTPLILVAGLAIFALAMRFDARDLARQTRNTDIAFWLHLLAAPMIVHSFIFIVFGDVSRLDAAKSAGLIGLFFALALVALVIDRRAILVSSLIYAGFAFGQVFRTSGVIDSAVPATLLVLGAFILLISAGWQPLRRLCLAPLPATLRRALPALTPGMTA